MFEKASEIRAAQRAKIWQRGLNRGREEGRKEGREEGREEALTEMRNLLRSQSVSTDPKTGAITLTPEDIDSLLGGSSGGGE